MAAAKTIGDETRGIETFDRGVVVASREGCETLDEGQPDLPCPEKRYILDYLIDSGSEVTQVNSNSESSIPR
jgi:hypothetical protein